MNPMAAIPIKSPGQNAGPIAVIRALEYMISVPQSVIVWSPKPKNAMLANPKTDNPIAPKIEIIIGEIAFGNTCLNITFILSAPPVTAALT